MIGMLTGTVSLKIPPYLILNVHDVGYKVLVSNTLLQQALLDDKLTLYTYTHVREDALELYGFPSPDDLRLFEYLISVSGVGCKSALGIFSVGNRSEIIQAIVTGNAGFFTSVPRLGKKNAQKIIIELKNKLGGGEEFVLMGEEASQVTEAIEALKSFGYSQNEAQNAIHAIAKDGATTEDLVKFALKSLGK
jgi:Holliday junction DNA helicase RuvA